MGEAAAGRIISGRRFVALSQRQGGRANLDAMPARATPPTRPTPRTVGPKAERLVVGGSLAGIAAAGRLAKLGYTVALIEREATLGGRYRGTDTTLAGQQVRTDALPGVLLLPAPWRDLFKKSGRTMEAELTRAGLALVPGPVSVHRFTDGTELILPAERGDQEDNLSAAFGVAAAHRWRDLVDGLVDVWQALRPLGLETLNNPTPTFTKSAALLPGKTVADLAERIAHPHLAALVRDTAWREGSDPAHTPAWRASRLAVERTFGRWILVDATTGAPRAMSELIDVLTARLATRKVVVRYGCEVTDLSAGVQLASGQDGVTEGDFPHHVVCTINPWRYSELVHAPAAARNLSPAAAPAVSHQLIERPAGSDTVTEIVEHAGLGSDSPPPVVRWSREIDEGQALESRHDFTRSAPDPSFGPAWRPTPHLLAGRRRFKQWLAQPTGSGLTGVQSPQPVLAGPWLRGGPHPDQCVLSGAIAAQLSDAQSGS